MVASPYPTELLSPRSLNRRPVRRPSGTQRPIPKVLRHPTATRSVPNTPAAPATVSKATVVSFPQSKTKLSLWLRTLLVVQQGSSLLTFCLATAVLIAYGSTVYIQQEWSSEYRKLEQLQREKRELIAANELMKNQLAQQANLPNAGLMPPSPANTIFLPKAESGAVTTVAAQTTTPLVEVTAKTPLGY
ncbi:MAG: hypothetical protein F6J87_10500 [Spirulina sp. SIO3F2]|nr:hypothetical protein [Spirulina sp. SIO3F2]